MLSIQIAFRHSMLNCKCVIFKINRSLLQSDNFFPAQTIKRSQLNGNFQRMTLNDKEHKPILYNVLLLSGKLTEHLVNVDAECRERLEILLPQMMQVEGVDEALKA